MPIHLPTPGSNDLLDLTRGQFGGGITLSLGPTDLRVLCRQVADDFALLHPHRPFHVEMHGELRGGWDGERVLQAITNLVGNALQHCDAGVVTVRAQGEVERATIEVHNPWTPIPPAVLPTIFEPFRRGDDSAQASASTSCARSPALTAATPR